MAVSTTNLVPLDFETIKSNLKSFLSSQTVFKDVDFNATNISVLLDVLAYNTYHNSFYMNMMASEMFLDTAQLHNSVTSHAKMLNYTPRSYRSAKAVVDVVIRPDNPSAIESILIPKGASFTGRAGARVYTFTTNKNSVVVNNQNTFVASGLEIFEGRYIPEVYTYTKTGRYVLSNPTVDTTSLTVVVAQSGGLAQEYTRASTVIGIANYSKVYFLQPAEHGQYEIVFGDGVFGAQPPVGSTVMVEYRVSSGELPNTASVFDCDVSLGGASDISVTSTSPASGGAVAETVDEVRFRAPMTYSTQYRAVTAADYKTLISNEFPDISDVGVFGGEDMSPPRYGHVAISLVSDQFDAVTDARKSDVLKYIQTKCPVTTTPLIVDPEFYYLQITSFVTYNSTATTRASSDLELLVLSAIKTHAAQNISGFDKTLYHSRLISAIDSADLAIVGNNTDYKLYKVLTPELPGTVDTVIEFNNPVYNGVNLSNEAHDAADIVGITSSFFTRDNKRCLLEDDGMGNIRVSVESSGTYTPVELNVGTVDYATGRVSIKIEGVSAYEGSGIRVYATLANKNVSASKNTVVTVKDNDVLISMIALRGQSNDR